MRPFVLCQSCKRHVKVSEMECPFCGTAVLAPSGQAPLRARGLPGGRAALFLAGSVLAPGCADEMDPDASNAQHDGPDAGDAAVARDSGQDAMMAVAVYGIAIDSGLIAVPYGIAVPVDAGAPDSGATDGSCPRLGNLPVPVYGVAVDSGPRPDVCTDAGQDAGKDAALIGFPPYGIAVDSDR